MIRMSLLLGAAALILPAHAAPGDPKAQVGRANEAARVQPERATFLNAIQTYAWADGALFQVYCAPGKVTDIALQEGEELVGAGPVAAGDTVRWIIGDTLSGSGASQRVHILAKPTRPDIVTNLVINTNRRTYHLELRATPSTYMAGVSWSYPHDELIALRAAEAECAQRSYRTRALAQSGRKMSALEREGVGKGPNPADAVTPDDARTRPQVIRLMGELPPVMRLSRKTLAIAGGAASLAIGGVLFWGLRSPDPGAPPEPYDVSSPNSPEVVSGAPASYDALRKLGPPPPAEPAKPVGAGGNAGVAGPVPLAAPDPQAIAAEQARERALQEREAAAASRLFLRARAAASSPDIGSQAAPTATGQPNEPETRRTRSAARRQFLTGADRPAFESSERVVAASSPYILQAGAVIPAALITGIRSDLPGQISAQVTGNVYDSPTGRILLVPQGARLVGEYDSEIVAGQSRVLLAWDRLILPGGRSIRLDRLPGADAAGMAGLEDSVNNHWGRMFRAALVSSLLGAGSELAASGDGELMRALRYGVEDGANEAGRRVVDRELSVPPTLTVRPGFAFRVLVTRDLILKPADRGERP